MPRPQRHLLLAACLGLLVSGAAAATDFRQTTDAATIGYDGPSLRATKSYLYPRGTPLEVVSEIAGWSKLRDVHGSLIWVERKHLGERTQVQVRVPLADIRQRPDERSPLLFQVEGDTLLPLAAPPLGGWLQVRLPNGQTGYLRLDTVFGI